mmetsp:Transcript_1694/g.2037  ORF Transcript_1694/g.2037 Transcript_1694/m.2037 type:complete len:215 (-) Transcript_1694:74-718(-)
MKPMLVIQRIERIKPKLLWPPSIFFKLMFDPRLGKFLKVVKVTVGDYSWQPVRCSRVVVRPHIVHSLLDIFEYFMSVLIAGELDFTVNFKICLHPIAGDDSDLLLHVFCPVVYQSLVGKGAVKVPLRTLMAIQRLPAIGWDHLMSPTDRFVEVISLPLTFFNNFQHELIIFCVGFQHEETAVGWLSVISQRDIFFQRCIGSGTQLKHEIQIAQG